MPKVIKRATTTKEKIKVYKTISFFAIHGLANNIAAKGEAAGVTAAKSTAQKKQARTGPVAKPKALQMATSTGARMIPITTELKKFVITMPEIIAATQSI